MLYGYCQGWATRRAAAIASHLAGRVVDQMGARPTFDVKQAAGEANPGLVIDE
jgi:hypothetical protein